jgi:cytochrome c oxidase subunit 3
MSEMLAGRTSDARRDTTAWLGMVIALVAWTMMFASLFLVMGYLRARAPEWPPKGSPRLPLGLPAFNTVVLLASSVALTLGVRRIRGGDTKGLARWLRITFALGALFVGLQLSHWMSMWAEGLQLVGGQYGATFYALTVFHAFHVLSGLAVLAWLLRGTAAGRWDESTHSPVRLGAMFWHFVDGVWVLMFVTIYLL